MPKPPNSTFGSINRPPICGLNTRVRKRLCIWIEVTAEERKTITAASMRAKLNRSEWCRRVMLEAAKQNE